MTLPWKVRILRVSVLNSILIATDRVLDLAVSVWTTKDAGKDVALVNEMNSLQ
jgi:hypothetical protein